MGSRTTALAKSTVGAPGPVCCVTMGVKSAVCLVVLLAIVLESSGQRNNRNNNRNNKNIAPTNSTPATWDYQPWSPTGHLEIPQPDNAEEDINGSKESCLGLLNNIYSDGIKWHDIACYHPKPFM